MQEKLIFVGSQFRINTPLYAYALRQINKALDKIDEIFFFDENDKAIFLKLESLLEEPSKLLIISSKNTFTVIGKLLCTLTSDTQIMKDEMLLPSQTEIFELNSYLLSYEGSLINTILLEPSQEMPSILFDQQRHTSFLHIFEQEEEDAKVLLYPLAESFDLQLKTSLFVHGWIMMEVSSSRYGDIEGFMNSARLLMPQKTIQADNIIRHIIKALSRAGKKVTCAESCTGGMISSMITSQSGSSSVFEGSLVTYSNEIKNSWLGVEDTTLIAYGAVSHETVRAMSKGAKEVALADFALAVSGIAGPTGAIHGKPVGTVYLSVCTDKIHKSWHLELKGDRNYVQEQSAYYAFKELLLSDKRLFFDLEKNA